jgi:hypothetical protein
VKTEPFGSILAYPSSPHPAFHRALTGSFSYMRNSVCKYTRNSGQFYCKKYRGIPRNFVCFSKNSVFRRKSKTHFRGHPIYRGVLKQFPLTKIIGTSTFDESFQSPFSLLLYTRTFFATPLAEKMHSLFFCQSLIRKSFSRFLVRYNFSPFLNICSNYSYRRILKPPC